MHKTTELPIMQKKTILFVHQSSELYGSDKTLLNLVVGLDKNYFTPIVVIPSRGRLLVELKKHQIKTIITPVLNIHKKMFNIKSLVLLPYQLFKSIKTLNKALKHQKIDVIQTNTVVVMLGFIYARLKKITHIWHIHEVMEKPKAAVFLFPKLVQLFSNLVIFNSQSTKESFCENVQKLSKKSKIIYNGLDRETPSLKHKQLKQLKEKLKIHQDNLVLSLVGRYNNNKGHELLLKSFKKVVAKHKNTTLLFTGSPVKGKEHMFDHIKHKIEAYQLSKYVKVLPFQNNIWDIWDITDIAIVPSTIKESFGLVALEAMLSSKPVIATNYGALSEVVQNNETGYLFNLNDEVDLQQKIELLIKNHTKRQHFGKNGKLRALTHFTLDQYVNQFEAIYK